MGEDDALALTRRVGSGSEAAFEELLAAYQDKIVNAIYRMVGSHDDALDLAQVTFMKAYQGANSFKGQSKLYTWLYRIAVNTVLSHRRRKGVREHAKIISLDRENPGTAQSLGRSIPSTVEEPSEQAERRERSEIVSRAIAELDDEYRAVVVLKDIESLSYDEIAEIMGCPRGTVKSRLHRARNLLKEKLKDIL